MTQLITIVVTSAVKIISAKIGLLFESKKSIAAIKQVGVITTANWRQAIFLSGSLKMIYPKMLTNETIAWHMITYFAFKRIWVYRYCLNS